MRPRIKWTERKFDFSFPSGLFPEMIERLRGLPPRLEEHLKNLPAKVLTMRQDSRWSMQENAGHLIDLESLVQQRIEEYVAGASVLHAADMSNRKTYEANYNEVEVAQIVAAFREARTATIKRLDELDDDLFARTALHPRLNVPMRLVDLLFFTAEHDDYHLTRIAELRLMFDKL
ncbi:MAG TPA: DinB family protein [Pyrinomonadaceae bacterium]|nr:DinB family protein [Pyrinomonadaceae bacterium]